MCAKKYQLFRQINSEIPKKENRKSKKYMEISMFYYVICVCMLHVCFFSEVKKIWSQERLLC